jgi:hypothetical protein
MFQSAAAFTGTPDTILDAGFASVGGGGWYRMDDAIVVSGHGDSVPDRLGGPALQAPDASSRPVFEAAGLGSMAALLGDGSNHRMSVSLVGSPIAGGSRPWFWLVLQKPSITVQSGHQWLGFYDGGPAVMGVYEYVFDASDPDLTSICSIATSSYGLGKAKILTTPVVFEASWGVSADLMIRNGVKMIQLSPDTPSVMAGNVSALWFWADNNGNLATASNLRIAEIVWTRSEPTDAQKMSMRQYARSRYGIGFDSGATGGRQLTVAGQSNGMFMTYLTEPNNWPIAHKRFLNRVSTLGPPNIHNNQGYWDASESSTSLQVDWVPGNSSNLALNLKDSIDSQAASPQSVVVWWQGESDPDNQAQYHDLFVELQAYVESGSGRSDLLWLIVQEHIAGAGTSGGVRAAEQQLCAESARRVLIDIDDLPAPHDGLHFWPAQYEVVLARCRAAARTYFGDAAW